MFSRKVILTLAVVVLSSLFAFNACAQWSPGGTMVYLGDLSLASSAGSADTGAYHIGMTNANVQNTNSPLAINSSVNSSEANGPKIVPVLDLSKYATSRRNNNLTGYMNIMYPLAESAGFTATTGSGGSSGGGCGCGG